MTDHRLLQHRRYLGPFRHVLVRPRLLLSICLGVLVVLFLPDSVTVQNSTRLIIGWNAGAILYLILAAQLMSSSSHEKIQSRAKIESEGGITVLVLVIMAILAALGAIVAELGVVKDLHGIERYGHIALAVLTILTSWFFTHVMFALHYAHDYYFSLSKNKPAELQFPGEDIPDYVDFLYCACVIGTSGQTGDVNFASKRMRRIGLIHSVLSFFFNTMILALTINIAAGLF